MSGSAQENIQLHRITQKLVVPQLLDACEAEAGDAEVQGQPGLHAGQPGLPPKLCTKTQTRTKRSRALSVLLNWERGRDDVALELDKGMFQSSLGLLFSCPKRLRINFLHLKMTELKKTNHYE